MTRREIVKSSAWAGILLTSSIGSLFQDFMGQEGYMRLVREHWILGLFGTHCPLGGYFCRDGSLHVFQVRNDGHRVVKFGARSLSMGGLLGPILKAA